MSGTVRARRVGIDYRCPDSARSSALLDTCRSPPSSRFAAGCRSAPSRSSADAPTCACGPRALNASRSFSSPAMRPRSTREDDGYFSGAFAASAGDRYRFKLDDDEQAVSGSGVALPARRSARPVGDRRSARRSAGPTTRWRGRAARRPGHLRDARRHVHAARARGPRPRDELRELARPRHHGDRGDAGRRVRRALRLGLRRRRPVRAVAPVRHARRLARASSTARTRSASASSSTSSTTTSARSATTCARSRRRTSPTATRTSGATRSTSTARTPARCASSSSRTPATGSTSSISTACASTRRSRSSTHRAEHILTAIGRRAREARRRRGRSSSSPRTSRSDTQLVRPIAEGGYGLDALWNDDFHHSAMVALTGRAEAYYTRHRGDAAGVHLGREVRLPVPGPALPLAAAAARHAGAATCRRRAFVIFLQNHDQVANSARGLRGASADQPGPRGAR